MTDALVIRKNITCINELKKHRMELNKDNSDTHTRNMETTNIMV